MTTTPSERGHRRPASTSTWPPTTRHGWCWGSCWQCEKGMPVPRTHCQGPRVGCDSDDNPPSRALNFARNGSLTCRLCATLRRSMVRNAIALVAHVLKNHPNCDPFACRQAPSFSANAAASLAFNSSAANLIARFNLLRRSDACRNKDDWASLGQEQQDQLLSEPFIDPRFTGIVGGCKEWRLQLLVSY